MDWLTAFPSMIGAVKPAVGGHFSVWMCHRQLILKRSVKAAFSEYEDP